MWLIDADGERFLDCYNNVPVVGHAHPRVTDAIARQSRLLNTNMRYLHDAAVELAERLIASMPADSGLDTVLFVNSGSEANDTAWRLATVWTGAGGGLASSFAYHGVTQAIADVSPEEWRGGYRPAHVEMFEALDPYRDDTAPEEAAEDLLRAAERLQERGILPAVTFVDGGFTSDGILAPPPAYVRALASLTHEVGALYVADEVQVGHGRTGEGLWSFAANGVPADLVTMGKPMGNGHPVAAVITRRELTERFAETTEWFSTFGGNPVACAAALAVLDVIEDEGLVARAARVGPALRAAIAGLAAAHPSIGDVRGTGLLSGVELVRDPRDEGARRRAGGRREGRDARAGRARRIDRPPDNVLKVRPPLVFGDEHIPLVVEALDATLRRARPLAGGRPRHERAAADQATFAIERLHPDARPPVVQARVGEGGTVGSPRRDRLRVLIEEGQVVAQERRAGQERIAHEPLPPSPHAPLQGRVARVAGQQEELVPGRRPEEGHGVLLRHAHRRPAVEILDEHARLRAIGGVEPVGDALPVGARLEQRAASETSQHQVEIVFDDLESLCASFPRDVDRPTVGKPRGSLERPRRIAGRLQRVLEIRRSEPVRADVYQQVPPVGRPREVQRCAASHGDVVRLHDCVVDHAEPDAGPRVAEVRDPPGGRVPGQEEWDERERDLPLVATRTRCRHDARTVGAQLDPGDGPPVGRCHRLVHEDARTGVGGQREERAAVGVHRGEVAVVAQHDEPVAAGRDRGRCR